MLTRALQNARYLKPTASMFKVQCFATKDDDYNHWPSNIEIIDKELMLSEIKAFEETVPKDKQEALKVERKFFLQTQEAAVDKPLHWWNKLKDMPEAELRMLPFGFLKKYGSYLNFMK
jgi:hypothetical protein